MKDTVLLRNFFWFLPVCLFGVHQFVECIEECRIFTHGDIYYLPFRVDNCFCGECLH